MTAYSHTELLSFIANCVWKRSVYMPNTLDKQWVVSYRTNDVVDLANKRTQLTQNGCYVFFFCEVDDTICQL